MTDKEPRIESRIAPADRQRAADRALAEGFRPLKLPAVAAAAAMLSRRPRDRFAPAESARERGES